MIKEITVIADGDVKLRRVVVSVENGVYFVCKREEFEEAKRSGRDPVCIGFKPEYVIEGIEVRATVMR